MKNRLKNYSFWVGFAASVMLVVKFVAENFGFKIDETLINNIINSILGILTIFGVINSPTKTEENSKLITHKDNEESNLSNETNVVEIKTEKDNKEN